MSNYLAPPNSNKASDIIRRMLMNQGGWAIVHGLKNGAYEICAAPDGISFHCDKIPKPLRKYEIFDVIVDLLISQGGSAKKGNGRKYKLGDPNCDETTITGVIGYNYLHKENGESVLDPVFVLAAVLDWAGNCK